ncbi:UDP-N-acetylmuramate dehydrogenase [Conchiformibius steedae]|uniref:UDP-N-acetylenolpyruvoylglucosamine reductase n=1 Tax=Conchiformibius steedae TaxID=153493 RepID=A0A3P2A546_9NEIS|nr:UDP-N-acetylmuramate dehydrogenase [Conchiformibius steedae]RRD90577.1 UDP-N-acetylmuramate dehydrogenase [Conchiformibius steedae]
MVAVFSDYDLSGCSTFHLPARAAHFCVLNHASELPEICALPQFQRDTVLWLGGGSNILFSRDHQGLVVQMANKGIREYARDGKQVRLAVQAGEVWHDFVQYTVNAGLSGLENLSLIPGTVGAAPVQNIGAYGVEVKDRIDYVDCFDLDSREFVRLQRDECAFAYRESLFKQAGKGRYVIVAVGFVLDTVFQTRVGYGDLAAVLAQNCGEREATAADVSVAVCQIRRSKLPNPDEMGNVGSFYKNPVVDAAHAQCLREQYGDMPVYPQPDGTVKLAAGWLIERCGLKGKQIGGAAVHDKQALVLINREGKASAADVLALSQMVCEEVLQRFGVVLVPEPNIL